ncbi:endonuclease domain-containing protein [Emticicia sp. W12TSBA100-4]|uniref:endonuclease domain-containing protein n=1 Tax=Emticicia sp. W12TSBA100-4 TaxID=3160965 RepID=UPI0033066DEB
MEQIHNRKELKTFRKKLRNHSTSAEATLWNYLKNSQLGNRKFRRQHSIGNYILDFYCPSEKIGVELDGQDHFEGYGIESDEKRTNYLNSLNIKILRFENKDIFENLEFVLGEIKRYFHSD